MCASQELQVEVAPGLFQMYRVGIRDEEEEDISRHFYLVGWVLHTALPRNTWTLLTGRST